MEIEIRRTTAVGLLGGFVLIYLAAVGYAASPRDAAGHPLLLLPEVRAVENYRQLALGWDSAWRNLDQTISGVLHSDKTQLLAASQHAQSSIDTAASLAGQVDAADAPAALIGLKDLTNQTATDYSAASTAAARWLSAPSSANLTAATAALTKARADRKQLEANAWLTTGASR